MENNIRKKMKRNKRASTLGMITRVSFPYIVMGGTGTALGYYVDSITSSYHTGTLLGLGAGIYLAHTRPIFRQIKYTLGEKVTNTLRSHKKA
jgi:hypothetical protein